MKKTALFKASIVSALFAAASAQADPANLLVNGDFELSSGVVANGSYAVFGNGSTAIAGWTVGAASVDLVNNAYGAIGGSISVDMLGTPGPGMIWQDFTAVAGQTYQLDFDLSRNRYAPGGVGVSVDFGGVAQSFFSTGTVDHYTMSFTAVSGGATTLSFASTGAGGNSGALIDNVSVAAAVPEPETYAMLLAGVGLVGFLSRRRKRAA